jgi:hypothetical protein
MKAPTETPGLVYVKRRSGRLVPVWRAPKSATKAGYPIKSWNLAECPPDELPARCQRIWAEALAFIGERPLGYDGTIRSLMRLYQLHADSPYRKLKPTTLTPYDFYISRICAAYGNRRIANITGLDVRRWNEDWRGAERHLAAAAMATAVLKTALGFGQLCGFSDCARLRGMLSTLRLPSPSPRAEAPGAADVRLAIAAALALGQPSAALCYALQFETAARQYDIAGQWVPLDDPRISSITRGAIKWLGPTWAAVDSDLILSLTPSKTERTTGRRVQVDLTLCPMVMEALAAIPPEDRMGPLIVDARTGAPFGPRSFLTLWHAVRRKAGFPKSFWNRDLRAGALTEGGMAGATADDRAKLAGHSPKMTREVYDRDVLVSSSRVAELRAKFRENK